MKKINFKDCKVGDYVFMKSKNSQNKYLFLTKEVKEEEIKALIFKKEYNSLKKYWIEGFPKTHFDNTDWIFYKLNNKEKEKYKNKIILSLL